MLWVAYDIVLAGLEVAIHHPSRAVTQGLAFQLGTEENIIINLSVTPRAIHMSEPRLL